MASITECPSCLRKLRVPDDLSGQAVRCPTCGTTFTVSPPESVAGSAAAAALQPPEGDFQPLRGPLDFALDDGEPVAVQQVPPPPRPYQAVPIDDAPPANAQRRCPHCRERIARSAVRCPCCGEAVDPEERPWERGPWVRRDCEPHRGTVILALGVLSLVLMGMFPPLGLPLGIAAWAMGEKDLELIRRQAMDPAGLSNTQAGRTCGIIGTVLNGLFTLGCGCVVFLAILG